MTLRIDPLPPAIEWSLDIYSPLGVLDRTITLDTSPHPIDHLPVAVVDACRRTLELRFRAAQSILQLEPRQIVRYSAPPSNTAVAMGVVVTVPPLESPGAGPFDADPDALERISCVGLEQLLRESVIGPMVFEGDHDVSTIAYELASAYAHPAIIVQEGHFQPSGHVLGSYYAPYKSLYDALEELMASIPGGGCFHVSADPALHLIWSPAIGVS